MNPEMAAAIVGAAIAALVAVVLFVVERSVARHAAFVERRRVAFDEVILSYAAYVAAALGTGGKPAPEFAAPLITSRGRMALALRKQDRALAWWLTGMEKRLAEAADEIPKLVSRIEEVNSNVTNTLLDIHLGVLNNRDLVLPAALYWVEAQTGQVPREHTDAARAAERPRPDPRNHGIRAVPFAVWTAMSIPFRRNRSATWAPEWADRNG